MCGRRILISRSEVSTQSGVISLQEQHQRALTNELSIGHNVRVKLNPQSFSVVCGTGTNLSVVRITGVSSGIPDGGLEDSLVLRGRVVLQEYMFDSPKTS